MTPGVPRPGRRGAGPRRIADALGAIVPDAAPLTQLADVQLNWSAACGAEVAARALPVSERDGTVIVACESATWAQELDLMQIELLGRLNARLDPAHVKALRFLIDPQ